MEESELTVMYTYFTGDTLYFQVLDLFSEFFGATPKSCTGTCMPMKSLDGHRLWANVRIYQADWGIDRMQMPA